MSPSLAAGNKPGGALEGQLAKYEVQLSDRVSCPFCTTPEGKAKIAEIEAKIKDIQLQMGGAGSTATVSRAPQATVESPVEKVPTSQRTNSMVGSRLDTSA